MEKRITEMAADGNVRRAVTGLRAGRSTVVDTVMIS
jgi:hypothetical protein